MSLTALKHGGTWDFLAQPFRIKEPAFERLISRFLPIICTKLHKTVVADVAYYYTLDELENKNCTFKHFKFAVEAVDLTFQQTNRQSGPTG